MSVTLKVNTISASLKRIQRKLDKVPSEAYQEFKKLTPVKTGNARRNTRLKGDTIEANYQYAQVLDKGRHMTNRGMRGSEQAPQGMTKPTEVFVSKRVKQILKAK
jgi:hypothetical protein